MHVIRPSHVLLCALGVVVVLGGGSYLLGGWFFAPSPRNHLPSAGDSLHRVPVWIGEGEDLRVVLGPFHRRPEADRADDALLSSCLFPDGEGARFAVLWIFNYASEGEITFQRNADTVRLEAEGGRVVVPLDLPAAVDRAVLRPDVRLGLRTVHAGDRRISVPAGTYRRILVALPRECPVLSLEEARVLGLDMVKRQVVRDRLENYLADPGTRAPLLPGGS